MLLDKAKALIAALIGFVASLVALKWGFNIPETMQVTLASGVVALLSGFFTWLTPNSPSS